MIPRSLIFIWLGSTPPPVWFTANMGRWFETHPEWEHRFITDDGADYMMRGHKLETLFHSEQCFAAKSDILRLVWLHRYGGVYVDGDMVPRRPIDELLSHSAFVGLNDPTRINNAIIGAEPSHSSIQLALDQLPSQLECCDRMGLTSAPIRTGPLFLNTHWRDDQRITKLPASAFYPYPWSEPWRAGEDFPDAYAVHTWKGSWRPVHQRQMFKVEKPKSESAWLCKCGNHVSELFYACKCGGRWVTHRIQQP